MLFKLTSEPLQEHEIDLIVSKKLHWILRFSNPCKVWLFGSASNNTMTKDSDVDLILVFSSVDQLAAGRKALHRNRPKNDWPHDLIFHTLDSWQSSLAQGGGAAWLASKEGKLLFVEQISKQLEP